MHMLLRNLRVSHKLLGLTAIALAGITVLVFVLLSVLRTNLMEDRMAKTRHLVEATLGLLQYAEQQERSGAMSREQAQKHAIETMRRMRYEGQEYFWMFDERLYMVLHPTKPELEGKDMSAMRDPASGKFLLASMKEVARGSGGFITYSWPKPGHDQPMPKISFTVEFPAWGWILGTGIYVDDVDRLFYQQMGRAALMLGAVLLLLLPIGVVVVRSVTRPIDELRQVMATVAERNDLTRRADEGHSDELGQMARTFNHMLDVLGGFVRRVDDASGQLSQAAHSLTVVTEQTAANVTSQRRQTDQAVSAMEQLSASVQEIAQSAANTAAATVRADAEATTGKREVAQTLNSIDALASEVANAAAVIEKLRQDSAGVETVLEVIVAITEQTNLLALNAAIEAARAGESGRGFAVVADEVRSLAQRTQQSAADIRKMVEALQARAGEAVAVMTEGRSRAAASVEQAACAGAALERIAAAVAQITEMTAQIATTAEQQSRVTEEVERGMVAITQTADDTSRGADQTAGSSRELSQLAGSLRDMVANYRV